MKKYFLVISSFAIISFIVLGFIGSKQREENGKDFLEYKKVMAKVEDGKELDKALQVIDKMQSKEHNDNYIFNLDKADVYIKKKEYKKALEEYKKVTENNISLCNNNKFLIDYAELALEAKDYKLTKELIEDAQKIGLGKDLNNKANEILSKVG